MFVENLGTSIPSTLLRRRKNRRRSLYFSSRKELQRSRMTRGKKVMSKTGQSIPGNLRKAIRFTTGDGSGEDTVGAKDLEVLQEMSEDTIGRQDEGPQEVAASVRT